MVSGNNSKRDQVTKLNTGRPMLTSIISEVPGLKVSANRKKRTSGHVDHSSTQPPAYERIKAQLERRKERQGRARQPQPASHPEKKKRNAEGGRQRKQAPPAAPTAVQHSGDGNNVAPGGRKADTRRNVPNDEDEDGNAAAERAYQRYREAKAGELERRRQQKELEELEMELDRALDNIADEGHIEDGRSEPEHRRDSEESQHGQVHPGSQTQAAGNAQHTKVSSQTRRQEHQARLERLASQKRSQDPENLKEDRVLQSVMEYDSDSEVSIQPPFTNMNNGTPSQQSESSVTESESELDVPMQPLAPPSPKTCPRPPSLQPILEPESEVNPTQSQAQLLGGKRVSFRFLFISYFYIFPSPARTTGRAPRRQQ